VSGRSVLITGVGGFVGGHLARRLADVGDRPSGFGVGAVPPWTANLLEGCWSGDVVDGDALAQALAQARPAAIVHLAAQSSGAASFEHPVETFHANAVGTLTLLAQVRRHCATARVLVVSTGEIYGPQPPGTRVGEASAFRPVSPYALSKAVADTIAETCGRMWSLDVVRVRAFGHFGPGQSDRFFVPSLARQIAELEAGGGEEPIRVGNLDVTRDLTDVRDVVEAYRALLDRGSRGAAYNVCRGFGVTLADLAEAMIGRARVPARIERDPARVRPADIPHLVGDPTAVHAATGWKPHIPIERTLDEVLDEWRSSVGAGSTPAVQPPKPAP